MGRGFPSYAELGPEAQAAVREARAADKGAPVVEVQAIKGHSSRGQPSKVELDYGKRLEMQRMAGELRSVEHQPEPIELPAEKATYRPDFRTVEASGAVVYVECKGAKKGKNGKTRPYYRDGEAKLKVKLAARVLSQRTPPASLVVVWPLPNGSWGQERVRP